MVATVWLLLTVASLSPAPAQLLRVLSPQEQLAASRSPNLLLFSVDDNVLDSSWKAAYEDTIVAAGARNPNGCRIPITWFSTCCAHGSTSSDCTSVQRAYAAGHELSTHTRTHSKEADTFTYSEWAAEVGGQRDWLVETCGLPRSEVVGFRAPYFKTNEVLGTVLRDLGLQYDSSLSGRDPTQRAYRMDAAQLNFSAVCATCGNWTALPIWEVPAMVLPGSGGLAGKRVDPAPTNDMTVLQRLQADFVRKQHSGVPVPLMFHEDYLMDGAMRAPILQFLSWALQQPDTWGVTYRQYLQWLHAPPGTSIASVLESYTCDKS
ncbi:hypothetical protein ABPG77_009753 [Micractinium sp. CCAP 211/92]